MNTVIIGAGIAGLAYSKACNHDCIIYEQESYLGGLCHSFVIDGFTFDSAVHLSFTDDPFARSFFDKTDYICHNPVSYNYFKGMYLKHPVANNLFSLPTDTKVDLIASFIERNDRIPIQDYHDYLHASFGDKIADTFQEVYTKKYWTVNSTELSTTWVGNRLCPPDIKKVLKGALQDETGNDYYAKEMRYPTKGAYQSFLTPIAYGANIRYNKKIVCLNTSKQELTFEDDTVVQYEKLASSMPLPELAKITADAPESVKRAAKKLWATKISLVSVALRNPDVAKWIWMYIYDQDIMAARVNSPSLKSPANAPEGCSSLQFEIYHKSKDVVDKDMIIENVRYSLKKLGLCHEKDILFMDHRILPYGNVIFYPGMEKDRELVRNFYESKGIDLIGRFGEWDYLWSDQSFMSGYRKGIMNIHKKQ